MHHCKACWLKCISLSQENCKGWYRRPRGTIKRTQTHGSNFFHLHKSTDMRLFTAHLLLAPQFLNCLHLPHHLLLKLLWKKLVFFSFSSSQFARFFNWKALDRKSFLRSCSTKGQLLIRFNQFERKLNVLIFGSLFLKSQIFGFYVKSSFTFLNGISPGHKLNLIALKSPLSIIN